MRHALLGAVVAFAFVALVWPIARGPGPEPGAGVCSLMTPSGILEHPALAHELAEALRSGDAAEVGRAEDVLREIRSVHGCEGEPQPARAVPALPPGHPPVHAPFVDGGPLEETPLFEPPGTVTI